MRVCVTGGCGFVGSVLVPKLLAMGHDVTVLDIMWFGNNLEPHENLYVYEKDIRGSVEFPDQDAIIHLAAVANDPAGDLDPKITWEINALATAKILDAAKKDRIKHFIYASSGSVYGISNGDSEITEESDLVPFSEYNKTKMVAERVALSYSGDMAVQIIRPATVCGMSPRLRLDLAINCLTMHALTRGKMTVFGAHHVRPNIHIEDMTDLYCWMLERPELTGVWNASSENLYISEMAGMIAEKIPSEIEVQNSNDPRTYRMNSDKLKAAGFIPKHKISEAVDDLIAAYKNNAIGDRDECYNVRMMKNSGIE